MKIGRRSFLGKLFSAMAIGRMNPEKLIGKPKHPHNSITWTSRDAMWWRGFTVKDGVFVAITAVEHGNDVIYTSLDGITWSQR